MLFRSAMNTLNASEASYFEYHPDRQMLELDLTIGLTEDETARLKMLNAPLGTERGLIGVVAQERKARYLPDVRADERFRPHIAQSSRQPVDPG